MSDLPEWVGFRPTSLHVKSCSGYSDDMSVPLVRKHTVPAFPASKTAPGPEIFPFEQDIFLHKHKILYFDEEVAELTNNQERLKMTQQMNICRTDITKVFIHVSLFMPKMSTLHWYTIGLSISEIYLCLGLIS